MDLTFTQLRTANVERCQSAFFPLDAWSVTDWACALGGEAGEACNFAKKLRRIEVTHAETEMQKGATAWERDVCMRGLAKELADVVIYADLLAARLGYDLGELVAQKFNEVSARVKSSIELPWPTNLV